MTFRQPLIYRWRQQKPRLTVHLAKIAHPPPPMVHQPINPTTLCLTPPKSDRLLVLGTTRMIPVIEPHVEIASSLRSSRGEPFSVLFQSRWFRPGIECQVRTTGTRRAVRGVDGLVDWVVGRGQFGWSRSSTTLSAL